MKKCPFCAEKIQDEAVVCRYCHREVPVVSPPANPPNWRAVFAIFALVLVGAFASALWNTASTPRLPADLSRETESRRHDLLFYGIRDAGKPCGEVRRAERRVIEGLWAVDCSEGRYYMVSWSKQRRRVASVMDCFDARDRLGIECWP